MYLENKLKNEVNELSMTSASDKDVEEATLALKGMLGIGSKDSCSAPDPIIDSNSSPKSSISKGTSIKNNSSAKSAKNNKSGKQSSPRRNPNRGERSSSNMKSKGSTSNPSSITKNAKAKENNPPQNYAWSAFQASPDASALPVPAFHSNSTKDLSNASNTAQMEARQLSLSLLGASFESKHSETPPLEIINALRAEDLEAQQIAAAEQAKNSQKSANADTPGKRVENQKVLSESGINLAAIASSPPSHASLTPRTPAVYNTPNSFSTPQSASHILPSHLAFNSPPLPPPQLPNHYHVPIQVQVPPLLGPDRLMIVHSPSGYPVQIVVPEGIPPGMVIPVYIPAGPMISSPFHHYSQQMQQQHTTFGQGGSQLQPYSVYPHPHYNIPSQKTHPQT
jgi:Proline-rich nuclear receptor coactivator motif